MSDTGIAVYFTIATGYLTNIHRTKFGAGFTGRFVNGWAFSAIFSADDTLLRGCLRVFLKIQMTRNVREERREDDEKWKWSSRNELTLVGDCVTVTAFVAGLPPFFLNILRADVMGVVVRTMRFSARKRLGFIFLMNSFILLLLEEQLLWLSWNYIFDLDVRSNAIFYEIRSSPEYYRIKINWHLS